MPKAKNYFIGLRKGSSEQEDAEVAEKTRNAEFAFSVSSASSRSKIFFVSLCLRGEKIRLGSAS